MLSLGSVSTIEAPRDALSSCLFLEGGLFSRQSTACTAAGRDSSEVGPSTPLSKGLRCQLVRPDRRGSLWAVYPPRSLLHSLTDVRPSLTRPYRSVNRQRTLRCPRCFSLPGGRLIQPPIHGLFNRLVEKVPSRPRHPSVTKLLSRCPFRQAIVGDLSLTAVRPTHTMCLLCVLCACRYRVLQLTGSYPEKHLQHQGFCPLPPQELITQCISCQGIYYTETRYQTTVNYDRGGCATSFPWSIDDRPEGEKPGIPPVLPVSQASSFPSSEE